MCTPSARFERQLQKILKDMRPWTWFERQLQKNNEVFDLASAGDLASSRAVHHTRGGCTIDLQHCCWLFLKIVITNHHQPDQHQYIQHHLSLFQQQQVEELDLSGYGRKTKGCLFDIHEKTFTFFNFVYTELIKLTLLITRRVLVAREDHQQDEGAKAAAARGAHRVSQGGRLWKVRGSTKIWRKNIWQISKSNITANT